MDKYLDTSIVKKSTKFYTTTFLSDMIFTKDEVSTSYEQVDKFTREFNIHHRACIGPSIYLLFIVVYLSFSLHKLAKFPSKPRKLYSEGLVHLLSYIRENKKFGLKHYSDMKGATLSDLLRQASIKTENQLMGFSHSSWKFFPGYRSIHCILLRWDN